MATGSAASRWRAPGEIPYVEATSEDGAWERGILAKDGTFRIPDLGPGTWIVTVRLGKRESSTRVRILPHDDAVRVDLELAEAKAPAPGSSPSSDAS